MRLRDQLTRGFFSSSHGRLLLCKTTQKDQNTSAPRLIEAPKPASPPLVAQEKTSEHKEEEANSEPKEEDGDLIFQGTGKNRRVWVVEIGLVDNFMPSDDLNEVVESLLHKRAKTPGEDALSESAGSNSQEAGMRHKRLHRQAFGDEAG